jgi:hypothetical protein
MILKAVICLFKGHDVDPDESIIDDDFMHDKRNWLCQCHRCGLYLAHDGAISQMDILMTKKGAYKFKRDYERDIEQFKKIIESL